MEINNNDVCFKFVLKRHQGDEMRRFRGCDLSLEAVRSVVRQWWPAEPTHLVWQYIDSDGDVVTLSTQEEWEECIAQHRLYGKDVVRVTITKRTGSAKQPQQVGVVAPEVPTEESNPAAIPPLPKPDALKEFVATSKREFKETRRCLREARKDLRKELRRVSVELTPQPEEPIPAPKAQEEDTKPAPAVAMENKEDVVALVLVFGEDVVSRLLATGVVPESMRRTVKVENGVGKVDAYDLGTMCSDLGIAALMSNDVEGAVKLYCHSLRCKPRDAISAYNYSCALCLGGKTDEALGALDTSVKLGYRNVQHMLRDADLAALRPTPEFQRIVRELQQEKSSAPSTTCPRTNFCDMSDMFTAPVPRAVPVVIPPIALPQTATPVPAPPVTAPVAAPAAAASSAPTDMLLAVFPNIDEHTASLVLEAAEGDVRRAIEMLLS